MYIYNIYIRGVTVHKIHGSVSIRHSGVTVRYVFGKGGGAIGYVAMLEIISVLNHEGKPITKRSESKTEWG